jgi:glyoxylate reductase
MKTILLTGDGYTETQMTALRAAGYKIIHLPGEPSRATLIASLANAHVHVLGGPERLSANEFAAAPNLEAICFVGTGYGSFIDEGAAKARNLRIFSTPGLMAGCVAEYTIGMLLAACRNIRSHIHEAGADSVAVRSLPDRRVGILGLGAIGERVARILANGFGVRASYHSRTRKPGLEEQLGLKFCELDALFVTCDTILLLLPTSPQTKMIVDARRLALLQVGSVLVNTAGAWLVDPPALRDALKSGRLEVAAFDGYYEEPLPRGGADAFGLLALGPGKFFVTPHVAAKTTSAWPKMLDAAVQIAIGLGGDAP